MSAPATLNPAAAAQPAPVQDHLKTTGAPSLEELRAVGMLPSRDEMTGKACLCIECIEEIPCNPCETSCPHGAITIGNPITNLPVIDRAKCTACGLCIPACPGLAITLKQIKGERASIRFPWEYLPLPAKGQAVQMVDREGGVVCEGTVLSAANPARNDRTTIVMAEFPAEFAETVVSIRRM